jgi:hypothetical protein
MFRLGKNLTLQGKNMKNFILFTLLALSLVSCKKGVPILTGGTPLDPFDGITGKPATISSGTGTADSGTSNCGALAKPCKVTARIGMQQWNTSNTASGTNGTDSYKLKGTLTIK